MSAATATARVAKIRRRWRRGQLPGFTAIPFRNLDGTLNLMMWRVVIPGMVGTEWEKGCYNMVMKFTSNFPKIPPRCKFDPPLYHPNVFCDGVLCINRLCENKGWKSNSDITDILKAIQFALSNPELADAVRADVLLTYKKNQPLYKERVRHQAYECTPKTKHVGLR